MKIYTMVKINMKSGEIIDESSSEYSGPVAECKGGSGDSVDEEYNARMATIAESQEGMAQEYFDWYKEGSGSYEQELLEEGSRTWVPEKTTKASFAGAGNRGEDSSESTTTPGYWEIIDPVYGDSVYVPDEGAVSYRDMESAQISANMEMIPKETAFQGAQIDANTELLPYQTDYQKSQMALGTAQDSAATDLLPYQTDYQKNQIALGTAQNDAATELLPQQTEYQKNQMVLGTAQDNAALSLIPQQTQGASAFYNSAMEGVDANSRADQAQADVASAFAGTMKEADRSLARMGVAPGSGRQNTATTSNAIAKAKAMGSARTGARNQAEQENFGRLQTAFGGV